MDSHRKLIANSARKYLNTFCVSVIPLGKPISDGMPEKERIDYDKRPDRPWQHWQERQATLDEVMNWQCRNLGLVTGAISGIIVVDCESRADAEWFWKTRGRSNVVVKTPRGFHLYFRTPGCHVPNAQRIEGRYDIRGDGGYVVCPPSIVNGKRYEFVKGLSMRPVMEMVQFQMEWRHPKGQPNQGPLPGEHRKIKDGAKYIATFRAVAGQAGHNTTWKAVQRLRDSHLSESEALAVMIEWNQKNCDPPWSMPELVHKVKGVYGSKA